MSKDTNTFSASELRSGLLVLASFAVLLVLLFAAGNVELFKGTSQVEIRFRYIAGLEKNAPVHFAGHRVGRVTDIRLTHRSEPSIAVTVSIGKDVVLKKDSEAYIDVMGFMGEKMVELTPGSAAAPPLGPGEGLDGIDPIALASLIKKGAEVAEDFAKINESLKLLVADLETLLGENRTDLDEIIRNLNQSSENLKEMTHDLKLHPWKLLRKGREKNPDEKKRRFLFF